MSDLKLIYVDPVCRSDFDFNEKESKPRSGSSQLPLNSSLSDIGISCWPRSVTQIWLDTCQGILSLHGYFYNRFIYAWIPFKLHLNFQFTSWTKFYSDLFKTRSIFSSDVQYQVVMDVVILLENSQHIEGMYSLDNNLKFETDREYFKALLFEVQYEHAK